MIPFCRNADIVSGNSDLEPLYTFSDFPVFMGCVDTPASQDIRFDMTYHISRSTGMIQINPLPPLEVVYQSEHGSGVTGPAWAEHHMELAKFIKKYHPRSIFEIGGGHGLLSRCYDQLDSSVDWTILEPNPKPLEGVRATIQKGFFTECTLIPKEVDMIVHSHLLEHLYTPASFFQRLKSLTEGVWTCFSIPALARQLAQCYTNVLNFEHTYFCIEEYIEWWLYSSGFEVVEKAYFNHDHSIFYAARKTNNCDTQKPHPNLYTQNRALFSNYIQHHIELVQTFNTAIKQSRSEIFLFGAHVFSQYLLAFGLDSSRINCIIDNSPAKANKRLYGTQLFTKNPSCLIGKTSPLIILRGGVFATEIKNAITKQFAPDAIFLE